MASSTFWAKLKHGNKKLDLDTEPYILAQSFTPPAINRSVSYSEGSGRRMSGGKRVEDKFGDRMWSFNVRVQGDTEAEVLGYINRLSSFCGNASDMQYHLELEYYPYSATGCIPLWGQGAYRYWIKEATCTTISPWLLRDKFAVVSVSARIGPVVEGQRQRVALASGGIYEDTVKTPDGLSRGVQVCTAGTNLATNPIFSNGTAWNSGWTATADLIATKITNEEYPIFGDTCVKIQNNGGTAGTANYTTTLTTAASTYVLSAYVKLLDERAPGTADMQLLCRGTALGAFNTISVGDNWYRIWDTAACPSAAGTVGIKLMNPGAACYFDGFQVELPSAMGTAPTPVMHGDALGCAWSSTRGASTTVRTAGALKLPVSAEIVNSANSSIRVVIRWNINKSDVNPDDEEYSFLTSSTSAPLYGLRCYYNDFIDAISFDIDTVGGVSVLQSDALTFTNGQIMVLYLTWGRTSSGTDQMSLTIDGTRYERDAINTTAWGTSLFVGSNYDSTHYPLCEFLDLTIFDRYLTAAEVAADYAQVYAHVTGGDGLGQALNRIPYLWTKDGDGVVDSVNDSDEDNFAVAAGIPGNIPAHTVYDMRATFAGTADGGLVMSNLPYKDFLDMGNLANYTSGTQGVGTVLVEYPPGGTVITITRQLDAYRGQNAYFLTSIGDAGTTYCRGRMKITYDGTTNAYYSDMISLATDGTVAWFLVGPMMIPDTMPSVYDWTAGYGELNFNMQLQRTSGTANIVVNSMMLMPGDFLYVPITGLTTNHAVIIDEERGYSYNSSTLKEDGFVTMYGDVIDLVPGKYNHLVTIPAAVARDANFADTVTFSRLYVTPRYGLL